jgi:hypothetical protein
VPIKPLKGETIRVRHPESFPYQVYRPSGGGVSPHKDGMVSVGASGLRTPVDKFLPGRFASQQHVEFRVEGVTV